jgi:hypothetical protein
LYERLDLATQQSALADKQSMNIALHYFVIDMDIAKGYSLIGDRRVVIAKSRTSRWVSLLFVVELLVF